MKFKLKTGYDQMDTRLIHDFLSNKSYWAKGIPLEVVETSLRNSWCVGAFDERKQQAGFARLITDYATFAYLGDVFVLEDYRGLGVSKRMMDYIMQEPWVKKLRRCMLSTVDAHGLYSQFGFVPLQKADWFMEISQAHVYDPQVS